MKLLRPHLSNLAWHLKQLWVKNSKITEFNWQKKLVQVAPENKRKHVQFRSNSVLWGNMLIIAWFLLISRMSYDCRYILWHMQGSAFLFACLTCSCRLFCLTEDGQTRSVVPEQRPIGINWDTTILQGSRLPCIMLRQGLRWEMWKAPLQGNDFWSWNAKLPRKKHSTHLRSQNALFRLSGSVHLLFCV